MSSKKMRKQTISFDEEMDELMSVKLDVENLININKHSKRIQAANHRFNCFYPDKKKEKTKSTVKFKLEDNLEWYFNIDTSPKSEFC